MRPLKIIRNVLIQAGVLLLASGCAKTIAPKEWRLPAPSELRTDAFGAWVEVEHSSEKQTRISRGELIAVQWDSVYLLAESGLTVVPRSGIQKAALNFCTTQKDMIGGWTVVGILSSASHGYYGLISAPIWLLCGLLNTAAESKSGFLLFPGSSWREMAKFARFPQGIPKDLDLQTLKPKPFIKQKD